MANEYILIGDMAITDFFTVKAVQWPNDSGLTTNAWPWMDFTWPQRVFFDKSYNPSAISISVAQHSGTVCFSDSSLYQNFLNRGRSFFNTSGAKTHDFNFSKELENSYSSWVGSPNLTMQGLNFRAQWDHAIKSPAKFILVTGWNEWVAQRQETGNDGIKFIDTSSMEFSRDIEMMISIPLKMLGITDYSKINIEFKWADSKTEYDEAEDFYCEGDTAPLGRLNYIYKNH